MFCYFKTIILRIHLTFLEKKIKITVYHDILPNYVFGF